MIKQEELATVSSTRIRDLKKAVQSADRELSTFRGRIFTEVFSQNAGESLVLKRSMAYRKLMETIPVKIYDHELIVGGITEKRKGAFLSPETNIDGMEMGGRFNPQIKMVLGKTINTVAGLVSKYNKPLEALLSSANMLLDVKLDNAENRASQRFKIGSKEKEDLQGVILPYWRKRNAYNQYRSTLSRREKKLMNQFSYAAEHAFVGGVFLFHPHIDKTVQKGLNAVISEAENYLSQIVPGSKNALDHEIFYRSAIQSCRAVIDFAGRYAALAETMANSSVSAERKKELLQIAEICRHVPANPPETFHEGLQAMWFIYIAVANDDCGHEIPFGRWDQVLYTLYERDIAAGRITPEQALELIECYLLKTNEIEFLLHNGASFFEDGNSGRITLTLGGVDENGNDATNKVSYLFLEALSNCRMIQPNPAIRIHRNTSERFLLRAAEIMGSGANTIQLFNDETVIEGFVKAGFPVADARNYIITGCVQQIPRSTYGSVCAAHLVLPRTLELFLKEDDEYQSYDNFIGAYKEYLSVIINHATMTLDKVDRAHREFIPNTFLSAITDGAMEKGEDVKAGGAKYNLTGISLLGLGTLADSLMAIKTAIYEEKRLTWRQLKAMLKKNYIGFETERLYLVNKIPKYGNDDQRVDIIARDIADFCSSEVKGRTTYRGGKYGIGVHSENGHVVFGFVTGPTPDGRRQQEPFSIGAGSSRGREKKGYTAALKSVSILDTANVICGVYVNLRFSPSLFDASDKIRRFGSMISAYFFDFGGQNLQTTVVGAETLKQAQQHPEAFQDLLVRISGYSARFVDLTKATQDEIITRTEFER